MRRRRRLPDVLPLPAGPVTAERAEGLIILVAACGARIILTQNQAHEFLGAFSDILRRRVEELLRR